MTLPKREIDHRLHSIQMLRAIAAVSVVIFHLSFVEKKFLPGQPLLSEIATHADAGVDLFFVLSGFVMTTLARRESPGAHSALRFLWARIWRVIPLYWIFTTLVIVLMSTIPSMVNSSYANQSILASYLLIPHTQLPVLAVGWTLVHEAYFYLAFAVALAAIPRHLLSAYLLAWASLVTAVGLWMGSHISPIASLLTSPLTLEFIAGALLGLHWRRLPRDGGSTLLGVGIIAILVSAMMLPDGRSGGLNSWIRVVFFGAPSLLIISGGVLLEESNRLNPPRWLTALGDSSYSLYLSHVFVISLIGRTWPLLMPPDSALSNVLFLIIAVVASCATGHAIHRYIEYPLLSLPRRWRVTGRSA